MCLDVLIAGERGRGLGDILWSSCHVLRTASAELQSMSVADTRGKSLPCRYLHIGSGAYSVLHALSTRMLCSAMLHAQVCSVVSRVLRHIANPEENPLVTVAPAPRPQQAPASAGAAAAAAKAFSSTGKDDYFDPHRTLATAAMSTASSASCSSSSRAAGAGRGFASIGECCAFGKRVWLVVVSI